MNEHEVDSLLKYKTDTGLTLAKTSKKVQRRNILRARKALKGAGADDSAIYYRQKFMQ
jgi:hypothetical protein